MCFRLAIIYIWLVFACNCISQTTKQICFYSTEIADRNLSNILPTKLLAMDSIAAIKKANLVIDSLNAIGYLSSFIIDLFESDTAYHIKIHLGALYHYTEIDLKFVPNDIKTKFKLNQPLTNYSVPNTKQLLINIAGYLENEGYQYAQIRLDSTILEDNKMRSILKIDRGTKVIIDSIFLEGNHSLPPTFWNRILNLKIGEFYSKSKLNETIKKINALSYIRITDEPRVSFYRNKALVHIHIKETKQSRVDALLGFLPSSPPENKLKLNGTFNALLVNQFNAGETILFNFQSLQNNSQHLKLDWTSPYLLNLPFSPVAKLNMFRRDSLFQEIRADIGASLQLAHKTEFRVSFGSFSSSLLKPDLVKIKQTKTLPPALDIKQTYATAVLGVDRLENGSLSQKGFLINLFVTGFSRNIKKNVSIVSLRDENDTTFSFESLYNPFATKGYAVELGVSADHYLKIKKYTVLYQSLRMQYKDASTRLQTNEMYRMGGYNSLRGFDEESIFATKYILLKNEFRLMTGNRSYLFSHMDIATMHQFLNNQFTTSNFLSLGAGLAVDTSLGILSVATSIGRHYPEGFDSRAVKLHVGYINYF